MGKIPVRAEGKKIAVVKTSNQSNDDAFPQPKANGSVRKPLKKKPKQRSDSSEDDQPLATPKEPTAGRRRKAKVELSSDDDKPIANKSSSKARVKKVKEDDLETQTPKKRAKTDDAGDGGTKKKRKKEEKQEEEQEEVFRWWDADANGDGSVKWQTLEHNGVIFPPPYEPLPKHIKMKYNGIYSFHLSCVAEYSRSLLGKEITLPPPAEEVAGFYAAMLETDHAQDATFNKNFFGDWKTVMKQYPPVRRMIAIPYGPSDNKIALRNRNYIVRTM